MTLADTEPAAAQGEGQVGFRRYAVEEGLSQGTITAILQDHEGFLWIGTMDGLNRFDGVQFRTFRHVPGDTNSLSSGGITSIFEADSNTILVGTLEGLNAFDRVTETFHAYPIAGADGPPTTDYVVLQDREAGIPAGSDIIISTEVGFRRFDRLRRELVAVGESAPPGGVTPPPTGAWTWGGPVLYALSPGLDSLWEALNLLEAGSINAVFPLGNGAASPLLIGADAGLFFHDPLTRAVRRFAGVPGVKAITSGGAGLVWVGTTEGLWTLTPDSTRRSAESEGGWRARRAGLAGLHILSLFHDPAGMIWVGTIEGLYRKAPTAPAFAVFRHRPDDPASLVSDFVMPMMEDRLGRVWIGTLRNGLSILTRDAQGLPTFLNPPAGRLKKGGLPGTNIRSILETRDGTVWMGTNEGLVHCTSEPRLLGLHSQVDPADTVSLWVDALCEARDGTLWAGASSLWLIRIEPGAAGGSRLTRFDLLDDPGEMASGVNVIVEASDGTLWIGTEAGLFHLDPATGAKTRFVHDHRGVAGLTNSSVWSLYIDSSGGADILWVGTSQGLNRFEPASGKWTTHLHQEGLPSDWIYGIIPDDSGRLWLTTNHGISCFDPSLNRGAQFRNFDATDGIAGDECNRRSFVRLRNGDILFGGTRGVTRFDPRTVFVNRHVPPVVLTSLLVEGRSLELGVGIEDLRELELAHDQNDLRFTFAALDYTNPRRNQYAYRMEGLDKDWKMIGSRPYAAYAGLPPGNYVFRVKASNNDGVWNEAGISLALRIRPPFWGEWWFLGTIVALVFLAVIQVFRLREKRSEEIFNIRRKIARDLHDEIGSNLTGIAVSGSLLRGSGGLTPEQEGRVSEMTGIAVRTSELMRDLIWVIRPEDDRMEDLFFRMKEAAGGILGGIRCHFTMPDAWGQHRLNLETKHNIYLIYKEIITNIARHARATDVEVIVAISGEMLTLTVTDNGVGFDPSLVTKGMGLKNLEARASLLGGTIGLGPGPGSGTRTTVRVPFT